LVTSPFFPPGVAEFVKANGVTGRALDAWEWEGFLRWSDTGLLAFVGSRAQQVYDAATYADWLALLRGGEPAAEALARMGLLLAAIPLTAVYGALLNALVYGDRPHWTYVYDDGRHAVLADAGSPANARLLAGVADGTLTYPDDATQALSRALHLASPAVH